MLFQVLLTTVVALGVAPCVLQRACPARAARPPSSVCMHRLHPDDRSVIIIMMSYRSISATAANLTDT
ncbi:unnamed protein product, partial [Brenthis ino]